MDLIGEMYHTAAVLINTPTQTGAGYSDNYTQLLTTRGALRNGGGSRGIDMGIIQTGGSKRLIVRFQTALWAAVHPSMKFLIDGVTYTTQSWELVKDRRRDYIEFRISSNNG